MCSAAAPGKAGLAASSFSASKEQAIVLLVVQQLAAAQFVRADRLASARLWQEVGALGLDIERVTHALYCGVDPDDREALRREDDRWLASRMASPLRSWGVGGWRLGWGRQPSRRAVCAS